MHAMNINMSTFTKPPHLRNQTLDRQAELAKAMKVQKLQVDGPWPWIWKTMASVSVVILITMAFHQAAKSTTGRKALHGGMSLPYANFDLGDSGDRWSTERLCRHFKVENPAQVQFAFRVNTPARLRQMIDNKATVNVIQTEIVYSQMEDTGKHLEEKMKRKKNVYAIPVISHSPYHRSTFTFDAFLEIFIRANLKGVGAEQGLMLTFKDPRAVIPCLKLLATEMRYGRMLGPIIIDAEVLPGPGGFLPNMASVFKQMPSELPGTDLSDPPVPGDLSDSMRDERLKRTVPFHPTAFINKVKDNVPGAILSIGWSAHGGCVDQLQAEAVRADYTAWYSGAPIPSVVAAQATADAMAAQQDAAAAAAAAAAGKHRRSLLGFTLPKKKAKVNPMLAMTDITESYDAHPSFQKGLDSIDLSEESFPYDMNSNAINYEQSTGYNSPMMSDAYWLLRNTTWRGDVIFNMKACLLASDNTLGPPAYKRLLQQKLGYTIMIHGTADDKLADFLKVKDLKNVPDPSTTFVGDVIDANGVPLTAKSVLLPAGPPKLVGLAGENFMTLKGK